ncbi:hypothetical protein [Streptomyces rubiginosohelvolus]|uniref:hypothetical protein n=1 Tax=Streptomyces rubiginosohelvolus TaxID=67362 RepID=UPI0034027C71
MTTAIMVPVPRTPEEAEDPFVLHGRDLAPGFRLEDTSRWSDPIWSLKAAQFKSHERSRVLNFLAIPDRFVPAAKTLFYQLLSGELPDGEDRPEIGTTRGYFTEFKRFTKWLDKRWARRPDAIHLGAITSVDLEDYLKHLVTTLPPGSTRGVPARGTVRLLWRWRTRLGPDALAFDPRHLDEWSTPHTPRKRGENATDRLPEEVLGPLVVWSLRFLENFAPDILECNRQWHERRRTTSKPPRLTSEQAASRLRDFLEEHVRDNRPLPGYMGSPNLFQMAKSFNIARHHLDTHIEMINDAARQVGVAASAGLGVKIRGRLNDRPWIPDIDSQHTSPLGLAPLARHLLAAAYVVIAYLSGMRDSEVKHLRRGCLRIQRDEDGNAYRWKVCSLAFKGEDESAGVPAVWLVGEPVALAIDVLEQLQPSESDYLFTALPHGPGGKKGAPGATLCNSTTNQQLNDLVKWINSYCVARNRTDTIPNPGHGKVPLSLKTSQFRRTLAWHIARRPGGVVAGAMQYRHHSIQMFEGYAGTSASGFRAEVESEQAIARGQGLLTMIEGHEHHHLAGPAAAEAERRLEQFGEEAKFRGRVVLDEGRLQRIMSKHDPAIYPGDYVTCVNDPAKALCEKAKRGKAEDLPQHGGCQPLACRNVALTPANIDSWQRELDRIAQRLTTRPPLPPLLQRRLEQRQAEISAFLHRHSLTKDSA